LKFVAILFEIYNKCLKHAPYAEFIQTR